MKRTLVVFAIALLGAGMVRPADAVVGGRAADDGEYPFMAAVAEDGFQFCGGSIVSSEWVLTAAHCTEGLDQADPGIEVIVGRTDLADESQGEVIPVASISVHPDYDPNELSHDAALLRLASPTDEPAIELATGPADEALEAHGAPVTVTGWGDQAPTFGLLATNRLKEADLFVVGDEECVDDTTPEVQVCAEDLLEDSCYGDSGGPLFAKVPDRGPVQIGVVSYGVLCAVPTFAGVYAEVNSDSIRPWITAIAGV